MLREIRGRTAFFIFLYFEDRERRAAESLFFFRQKKWCGGRSEGGCGGFFILGYNMRDVGAVVFFKYNFKLH